MKTKRRIYVPDSMLTDGAEIALHANQSHYLMAVLRLGMGAEVHLFNAGCGEWSGKIANSKKQEVVILLEQQEREPLTACICPLTLSFAPLKKDRTDFLVEKASEIGVHMMQPIFTDHTQSDRINTERLQATAIEAAEQCDRLDAPKILVPMKLENYLRTLPDDTMLFLAAESGDAMPIADAFEKLKTEREKPKTIHFLIGPEGGFSANEFALFGRYPGIRRIRLGPRLLRAETAAVATLSAFQAVAGDWK